MSRLKEKKEFQTLRIKSPQKADHIFPSHNI